MIGPKVNDVDSVDEHPDDCVEDPLKVDFGILETVGDEEKEIDEKLSEDQKLATKKKNFLIRRRKTM